MLKYEEIIVYIKNEILIKNYMREKKLPSIRTISQMFNCSIGTALKAYEKLEEEHAIYSLPKSGYYALEDFSDASPSNNLIIDFASGATDMETFHYDDFQLCLNKAIDLHRGTLFSYSEPRGLNSLIDVLVKHLRQYQIFTKPDNVIIASSSQQVLNILSIMPFPNGKSKVLVEQPTYYGVIKSLELNNVPSLGIDRGINGIDLDKLEHIFKHEDIKFFYTVSRFHNPTGNSYSKYEKEIIIKLAEKYDVYILEDDIVADLEVNKKNDPMFSYDINSRIIYLKSYSKIIMPGLRVATLILPTMLINTFLDYKKWTDMNSPILSQSALEIYIKSGMFNIHRKAMSKIYCERLDYLRNITSIYQYPEIKWSIPNGGYFGCIYIPGNLQCDKLMSTLWSKNIQILDSKSSFLKKYKTSNYFRISVSRANKEKIEAGIPILLDSIRKYLT